MWILAKNSLKQLCCNFLTSNCCYVTILFRKKLTTHCKPILLGKFCEKVYAFCMGGQNNFRFQIWIPCEYEMCNKAFNCLYYLLNIGLGKLLTPHPPDPPQPMKNFVTSFFFARFIWKTAVLLFWDGSCSGKNI